MNETLERVKKAQPEKTVKQRPEGTPFAEMRISDPDGNLIDLSVHGFLDYRPSKKA
jgi:hypothetical protein